MKTTSSNYEPVDAVVVGAGIAGCASAYELLSTGWRIALLHQGNDAPGMESITPDATRKLKSISVNSGILFSELTAWWGTDQPARSSYPGASIVQRMTVAREFRAMVQTNGAQLIGIKGAVKITRDGEWWRVEYEERNGDQRMLLARFLVDATGRVSTVARTFGAVRKAIDQLYSLSVTVDDCGLIGVWTESVSDGWWNFCSDGQRGTLSFYTTSSIARQAILDISHQFSQTEHLRQLISPLSNNKCSVRLCGSSQLRPCAGPGWVAVGDAAISLQPLASGGVASTLRDAKLARRALEVSDNRYDSLHEVGFEQYRHQLLAHYNLEKRWPMNPFWNYQQRKVIVST